jgi:phospholipid/cholesterol/gamma-HCH transport system ATP-binding protein
MIRLQQVSKSFGEQTVLRSISTDLREGETLFVVGQSGSGKSVLMRLILGLLPVSSGHILFDGKDVTAWEERAWYELRQQLGIVFQQSALFDSQTVFQNVAIRLLEAPRRRRPKWAALREQVAHTLALVGLSPDILDRYPAQLSGGMQKRVGIARAIIHRPRYLFYDEPTTGLDPESAELIDQLIDKLNAEHESTSTIVISHDMASVRRLADRVLLLYNQQLHYEGSAERFFCSEDPTIRRFLRRYTEERHLRASPLSGSPPE